MDNLMFDGYLNKDKGWKSCLENVTVCKKQIDT